ncbi:MAG: NAD(P)/FAD-dependent oxidoreductase [Elusimicrobiota bacterium]
MKMYDVIIIGGGVVGSAIAHELSRYKLEIALLEKETELAFGVSKSNSGIIHPGTQNPPGSLKGKLCVRGNKLTRKIALELGIDFKEVGELIVAFSESDMEHLKQIKSDAEKLGVRGLKIVNKAWLTKHEPNLSDKVVSALYAPTAGIISPYRFVYDLSENAANNGVKIFTDTEVKNIKTAGKNNFELITQNSVFKTSYVVNAAGLYADEVSAMIGIDDFKISPRKGEEYILDKKLEHISNHLIFPLPEEHTKGILIIKTADGNPMVGPTAKEQEDKEGHSTSDEGIEEVFSAVKKMMPKIDKKHVITSFAGLRPIAGKDFIIRHEDKVPGFVNVAGIQSPGLTAAPAIAEMVARILKDNGLKLKKKPHFKKHRRKTTHLFALPLKKLEKLIKIDPEYGDIVCRCEMVSVKEIRDAIKRGAKTLDGVKFRTRAQAGRCHGGFCTCRIMKILSKELNIDITTVTKRGRGSEIVIGELR